eukprot:g412.t1
MYSQTLAAPGSALAGGAATGAPLSHTVVGSPPQHPHTDAGGASAAATARLGGTSSASGSSAGAVAAGGAPRVTVPQQEYVGKLEQDLTYLHEHRMASAPPGLKVDRLRMHRSEVRRHNMKEELLNSFERVMREKDALQASFMAHRVVDWEQWRAVLSDICTKAADAKASVEAAKHVKQKRDALPVGATGAQRKKFEATAKRLTEDYLRRAGEASKLANTWREPFVRSLYEAFGGDFIRFASTVFELLGDDAHGEQFAGVMNSYG